jgi:hypothetical protein
MHRTHILALLLTPLLVATALGQSSSGPIIHFFLYAPTQKDSPIQIARFDHTESDLEFVLSNTSDKAVVAVTVGFIEVVPRGCSIAPSTEPYQSIVEAHAGGFKVSIPPHGEGIAAKAGIHGNGHPGYPHLPERFVDNAKRAKAGYMQVQIGITGVLFQDGTSWPAQVGFLLRDDYDDSRKLSSDEIEAQHLLTRQRPFDDALADAETSKCADVAAAANDLQSIDEVVFERDSPHHRNAGSPPQLQFSCSLVDSKAVCGFR